MIIHDIVQCNAGKEYSWLQLTILKPLLYVEQGRWSQEALRLVGIESYIA